MKEIKSLVIISLLIFQQIAQCQITSEVKPFSIGETFEMYSENLNEQRTINVYLPNNYQTDSSKKYPVIYLLDGSHDEDFIHIAGLVQFSSFSWINTIPESIVIGIANVDRKRDFTFPTSNEEHLHDFPSSGSSGPFIEFIENELQVLINDKYQTNESKTLIGQSLGGLLATEILFKHTSLFDHYIIISPSLWWDDQSLLEYHLKEIIRNKDIYVGVGKEGEVMEADAEELHKKLTDFGVNSSKLYFSYFEDKDHGDVLHLAAYDAFEKLFKTSKEE